MNITTPSIPISSEKVTHCHLEREIRGKIRIVSGIIYENHYYVKIDSFCHQEYTQAQWKSWALKGRNIPNLIVKNKQKYVIWAFQEDLKLVTFLHSEVDFIYGLDLKQLVTQMGGEHGVEIKNRVYKFKIYPQCFIGSEAVDWLKKQYNISRSDAIELGQRLRDEKWLHHVCDEHDFEDGYFFYRFLSRRIE